MSEGDQGHNWMPDWFWDSIEDEPETIITTPPSNPVLMFEELRAKAKAMNFGLLYGADPNKPVGQVINWQPSPTGRLSTGIRALDLTFGGGVRLNVIKNRSQTPRNLHLNLNYSQVELAVMAITDALHDHKTDLIVFDSLTSDQPSPEGRSEHDNQDLDPVDRD